MFLMILSLIFNDNFYSRGFYAFPNFTIVGLVYISAYLDLYPGWLTSYILFYIYGSMTPLNPAVFGLIGTVSYAVSYILWRKIPYDNAATEILIAFIVSWFYYIMLFLIVFYCYDIHFLYWNFLLSYYLPVSVSTALLTPALFFFFKKIGYRNFLKKKKLIYL
ncbi:MAG: hypothetical protein ACYCSB_06385 [bacterium]